MDINLVLEKIIEKERYKILQQDIGNGSSGKVSLAFDTFPLLQKNVAIKFTDIDSEFGLSSVNEINVLFQTNHPNIIKVYDLFNSNSSSTLALVMEYQPVTLYTYLENHTLTFLQKKNLMQKIACGLEYLHFNNVLHLDLKLENILLNNNSTEEKYLQPKIIDFGSALVGCRQIKKVYGTLVYMAPELFLQLSATLCFYGIEYNEKVDIWALGMLYLDILYNGENPLIDGYEEYSAMLDELKSKTELETIKRSHIFHILVSSSSTSLKKEEFDGIYPLLSNMLQYNAVKRYNITQVSSSSFFFSEVKTYNTYKFLSQIRIRPSSILSSSEKTQEQEVTNSIQYLVRNLPTIGLDYKIETLFLAVDLYHRLLHYFDSSSTLLPLNILILLCFDLAIKIVELDRSEDTRVFKLLLQSSTSQTQLYSIQMDMIKKLNGRLYVPFLFEKCKNMYCVYEACKLIFTSNEKKEKYYEIDPEQWFKSLDKEYLQTTNENIKYSKIEAIYFILISHIT